MTALEAKKIYISLLKYMSPKFDGDVPADLLKQLDEARAKWIQEIENEKITRNNGNAPI